MGRIAERMLEYGTLGGMFGAALDGIMIVGATALGGPVGLAAATTVVATKAAAGTIAGTTYGAIKGAFEELDENDEEE